MCLHQQVQSVNKYRGLLPCVDSNKSYTLQNVILLHVVVARIFSPVFNSTHAIAQVMNINPTAVTLYGGTKLGEFTPLEELLLVKTPCQTLHSTVLPN